MKTLIYRKHLVIYTDEADKLNKIGKLNRGDLKGFIFVSDSIIHHFIDEKKELERQLKEVREFAIYKIKHVEQLIEQNNLLMEQLKEQEK
jgi:hypothetical protein